MMTLYIVDVFCCDGYGDHLDLHVLTHSVPTRRSSDLALERNGRLYNCAVIIKRGVILGVVPKTFLPNYREYYEKRWFASGMNLKGLTIKIGDQEVPFGTDLVFCGDGIEGFTFAAEICEDFWAPTPPSTTPAHAAQR